MENGHSISCGVKQQIGKNDMSGIQMFKLILHELNKQLYELFQEINMPCVKTISRIFHE